MRQKDFRRDAKVLIYDLEVSGRLGWYYGVREVNPIREELSPILLSVAWKWLGEEEAHCLTLYDRRMANPIDDRMLVGELWNLFEEAKIVVGFNNKRFDEKVANSFFIKHGMNPPSPYQEFDVLQTARKYFRFENNKLDNLGKILLGEGKTKETYADCWYDLLYGNDSEKKSASEMMKNYNLKDVDLTERLYNKFLPWANNHPNMALAAEVDFICPRCGRDSNFRVKAYRRTGAQINAIQYLCKNCGGYVTKPLSKEEREELAEEGKLKSHYRNTV